MKHTILTLLIITAILAGCKKNIDLSEGQEFKHALVSSEEQCRRNQPGTVVFNCFQRIEFEGGKNVIVVMTDIVNAGRYKQRGKKIFIELESGYDVERKMELEIINSNTLRYKGTDFKRWKGPGAWDFY